MKRLLQFLFPLLLFVFISGNIFNPAAQTKNPVIEFCTGTWCQWCPCGDFTIENLLEDYPNLIPIAYHGPVGSDPYASFPGNTIIGTLGFQGYPTATINRTNLPGDYTTWTSRVVAQANAIATVSIDIEKSFDEGTGQLEVTINMTPLEDLTGQYKYNIILTEDSLIYNQVNNGVCVTGGPNWVHYWVVRDMINGASGENVNATSPWITGDIVTKTVSYNVSPIYNYDKCNLIVFVYKQNSPLYMAEIQQAEQWDLTENIVPVEFTSFIGRVTKNDVLLDWKTATETNNSGFEVQRKTSYEWQTIGFINGSGTTTQPQTYSYTDAGLAAGTYIYRLNQVDFDGTSHVSNELVIVVNKIDNYSLDQNYPNPFNPTTKIKYSIPSASQTSLKVYDVLGNEVITLVNGEKQAGTYEVDFNAASVSSGVYFYKLQSGGFVQTRKMIVLK